MLAIMQSKVPGKGPLYPLRLDSLGVKVQSRVKVSRKNRQAVGVKVEFTELGMEKTKQRSPREQMLKAGDLLRKTKGQVSGCHGKARHPGKPSRAVGCSC